MRRLLVALLASTAVLPACAQGITKAPPGIANSQQSPVCPPIEKYGGQGNGVKDNLPAWKAAVAGIGSGNGCISFGPGTYLFSGQPTWTLGTNAAATVQGAGSGVSFLYWPATSGGMVLNLPNYTNAVHIQGLSFTTGVANGGTAIALNQTNTSISNPANTRQSTITDVTVAGSDGGLSTDYWTDGTVGVNVSNVSWTNYNVVGSTGNLGHCVNIAGTSAVPAVVFAFSAMNCIATQYGVIIGNWVQGVAIGSGSNFTGGTTGVYIPATTTAGVAQININQGTQFATIGHQVDVEGYFGNLIIQGGLFYAPATFDGVHINSSTGAIFNIVGNQFLAANGGSKGNGVNIVQDVSGGAGYIGDNLFSNITDGIILGSSSHLTTIGPNSYIGNGLNISDGASDTIYPDAATIAGASGAAIAAAVNTFVGVASNTTENKVVIPSGRIVRVKGLQVVLSVAPGSGESLTATFRKNGASPASGPACTISDTSTTCSDTTHTTTMVATDVYDVFVLSSGGAATPFLQWSAGVTNNP